MSQVSLNAVEGFRTPAACDPGGTPPGPAPAPWAEDAADALEPPVLSPSRAANPPCDLRSSTLDMPSGCGPGIATCRLNIPKFAAEVPRCSRRHANASPGLVAAAVPAAADGAPLEGTELPPSLPEAPVARWSAPEVGSSEVSRCGALTNMVAKRLACSISWRSIALVCAIVAFCGTAKSSVFNLTTLAASWG